MLYWSWLWLRSVHWSISVVCGIRNVVGLSYPAWGHSWTTCGHSWIAYGWSWGSDQYNHSKLCNWCDFYVFIHFKICICIYVYLLIILVYSWVEGDSTLLIVLMRKSRSYNCGKWEWEFNQYLRGIHKKRYWIWAISQLILVRYNNFVYIPIFLDELKCILSKYWIKLWG